MKRYLATFKVIIAVVFINLLCLAPLALKAQDPSCGATGNDPDPYDYCPLDTWVWVLAAVVVVFVVVKMNRKAKLETFKTV
jgi:hypothetical protein